MMKGFLIIALFVFFVCAIAVPVDKIKSRARQSNKEEVDELELELKDLRRRINNLKGSVNQKKTEGGGASQTSNDELEKEKGLERGGKTFLNLGKAEQPTGPVVLTVPAEVSETNIKGVLEKVAKTVTMLEKMLEDKKHTVTQLGRKQTAVVAKTEPETEPTTHHIQNTAEPAKVSSTEKPKINGQRTTVPTEAVIKSAAINELEDDLEITVKKLIKEPEPGAITTRTLEPEVKTTRTPESKVKTNEFKGEVEITVEKVTREPEPATKSTPAPEPEIQTSNALKVEELESETGGGPQEETKITIEKITKPTQASARGKTQQSVQPSTESEPKAQIISIEKIIPGKDTNSVTGDGKKTAEKLEQQLSDEELELGTQKRTEVTAEHAQKSQPTRQKEVIEPTPTPDKKAIEREEEKLEHELEKENVPKRTHPLTQVPNRHSSSGTDKLVPVTGKSSIIVKTLKTTAKKPTLKQTVGTMIHNTEKDKKASEQKLEELLEGKSLAGKTVHKTEEETSSKKEKHISDELQEELANKLTSKIEKFNTRKTTKPITEPVKLSTSPIPRETTRKTVVPLTKTTQHVVTATAQKTVTEPSQPTRHKVKTRKPGLPHPEETKTAAESTRRPAHNVEELEEELERQLTGKTARVRKSKVNKELEEDLREIALH